MKEDEMALEMAKPRWEWCAERAFCPVKQADDTR
ncbi:hypothetical protein ACSSV1_001220 [Labrenzia sp. MBR-25]